jgi:cobalt-zinc-cadmium efflux system membrane fusion protein
MKKSILFFLCALTIIAIALFTLYEENAIDIDKLWANLLLEEQQKRTVKQMENDENKERSLDQAPEKEHENDHDEALIVKLTDDQIKKIDLQLQTAASGKMLQILSTRGKITLDPDRLAHIMPKISGIAKEARKNIGNDVREGEILAILESQEIADLKAAYLTAISKKKLALSILEREDKLFRKGVSAGQDFLNAQNAYDEALINLQLAIQKLQAVGIHEAELKRLANHQDPNLRYYTLYAPIDGTVIMRHITQGEHIDNTMTIYEIANFNQVWVEVGIYPKDLPRIREGQMVEVINPEINQSAQARLIYVSPLIANETITAKAIALLDNAHGAWRPGMFVKVNIATDCIACPLLIAKQAIQNIDGKDCAFVATEQGFETRALQLGRSDHQNIEVLSGLLPGEKYVANHSFLLKAEMKKESVKDD